MPKTAAYTKGTRNTERHLKTSEAFDSKPAQMKTTVNEEKARASLELQCFSLLFPILRQWRAKISGNALKQGGTTHSMLRQPSSQLQKYKAAH